MRHSLPGIPPTSKRTNVDAPRVTAPLPPAVAPVAPVAPPVAALPAAGAATGTFHTLALLRLENALRKLTAVATEAGAGLDLCLRGAADTEAYRANEANTMAKDFILTTVGDIFRKKRNDCK